MVIVFDTNVLLSALFFKSGTSSSVLRHAVVMHDPIISDWILDEFTGKLNSTDFRRKNRNYIFAPEEIEQITSFLQRAFTVVTPTNPLPTLCRDADDNHILQVAEFSLADYIITGDKDLLVLDPFDACRIVTPRTFSSITGLSPVGPS